MRSILSHLRRTRNPLFPALLESTPGVSLEHPLLSELHAHIVAPRTPAWQAAEKTVHDLADAGLFDAYLRAGNKTSRWLRRPSLGQGRGGHQMVEYPSGERFWVFGGFDGREDHADLHFWDVGAARWVERERAADEPWPERRSCHKWTVCGAAGWMLGRYVDDPPPADGTESGPSQPAAASTAANRPHPDAALTYLRRPRVPRPQCSGSLDDAASARDPAAASKLNLTPSGEERAVALRLCGRWRQGPLGARLRRQQGADPFPHAAIDKQALLMPFSCRSPRARAGRAWFTTTRWSSMRSGKRSTSTAEPIPPASSRACSATTSAAAGGRSSCASALALLRPGTCLLTPDPPSPSLSGDNHMGLQSRTGHSMLWNAAKREIYIFGGLRSPS
jgi:hypothetical protein